jgi:hypothetical protein
MDEKQRALATLIETPPSDPLAAEIFWRGREERNHLSAIGRVAAAWSMFEMAVDTACIRVAGLEAEKGICFTSQIAGIVRKLDAYIALARFRPLPENLISRLNSFHEKARKGSEKRNRLVHDVWYFNQAGPPERLEATARRLLKFEYIPTTIEYVMGIASEINNLTGEFEVLHQAVETWQPPSPEKSPSDHSP